MQAQDNCHTFNLEAFHQGDRTVLSQIYREHIGAIEKVVSRYCRGVDAENIIHDMFLTLIEKGEVRRQFNGGNMQGWLSTIASRKAIDYLRKMKRMVFFDDPHSLEGKLPPIDDFQNMLREDQIERLKQALNAFASSELPRLNARLAPVFELRYLKHCNQMETAKRLGIPRTTLIDREQRLMKHLGKFLKKALGKG